MSLLRFHIAVVYILQLIKQHLNFDSILKFVQHASILLLKLCCRLVLQISINEYFPIPDIGCAEEDSTEVSSTSEWTTHMVRGTWFSNNWNIFYYGLPSPFLDCLRRARNPMLLTKKLVRFCPVICMKMVNLMFILFYWLQNGFILVYSYFIHLTILFFFFHWSFVLRIKIFLNSMV